MSKAEAKINRELLMLSKDQVPCIEASLNQSQTRKLLIVSTKPNIPDMNAYPCSDSEGEEDIVKNVQKSTDLKPQYAEFVAPQLFYELQVEIYARVPCFEYWKLHFLNKQFSELVKSCEIFKVRQERELVKPYVFMLSGSDTCWTMFDEKFENFRKLPEIPSDYCFFYGDKETISAGTHLIVIGRDFEGIVVWRYQLEKHQWFKGPAMITPRVMYGSASCGTNAFFAGGITIDEKRIPKVVNIVEKYNADTETWTMIHGMHKRRKFSSGFFLHSKFYVLGGRDENDESLTCGECYDEMTNSWKLIPDMFKGLKLMSPQSPPLIAVVDNNLYALESSLNELWVYDINANVWKKLGGVPVRADASLGWGVAFKSLGDRLLVIGSPAPQYCNMQMAVYTCRPSPDGKELRWEEFRHCCDGVQLSHFIRNCCVMFA